METKGQEILFPRKGDDNCGEGGLSAQNAATSINSKKLKIYLVLLEIDFESTRSFDLWVKVSAASS